LLADVHCNSTVAGKVNVIGNRFDDIKERFEKYLTTDKPMQSEFEAGCVHLVVWPS